MEQFDLLSSDEKSQENAGIVNEIDFLGYITPELRNIAANRNAKPKDLSSEVVSGYSSIKFRSSLIAKVKLRGKIHYIAIPDRLKDSIPSGVKTTRVKSDKQFARIDFDSLDENTIHNIMENATILAIERVPKEFDCCSRYEECSNARVCVHPDPSFSMLCGYRKVLKAGKVFYGINRNID